MNREFRELRLIRIMPKNGQLEIDGIGCQVSAVSAERPPTGDSKRNIF